jgi:hypothetical protein
VAAAAVHRCTAASIRSLSRENRAQARWLGFLHRISWISLMESNLTRPRHSRSAKRRERLPQQQSRNQVHSLSVRAPQAHQLRGSQSLPLPPSPLRIASSSQLRGRHTRVRGIIYPRVVAVAGARAAPHTQLTPSRIPAPFTSSPVTRRLLHLSVSTSSSVCLCPPSLPLPHCLSCGDEQRRRVSVFMLRLPDSEAAAETTAGLQSSSARPRPPFSLSPPLACCLLSCVSCAPLAAAARGQRRHDR